MNRKRQWEEFWETEVPRDFMRLEWQFDHPARLKVYQMLKLVGGSILDVGCATGIDYPHFKKMGMKYTGIDITRKFVDRFKELHPEADVRLGTALSLPFPDKHFTVVYAAGVIQHLHPDDYPKGIQEMWRVCRKILILTTSKSFTKDNDIIQMVRKGKVYDSRYSITGFKKIIAELPLYSSMKIFENIKHVKGEPVTIAIIMKKENIGDVPS